MWGHTNAEDVLRRRLLPNLGGALSIMTISSQTLTMAAHTREKISAFRFFNLVKVITGTLQSRIILYATPMTRVQVNQKDVNNYLPFIQPISRLSKILLGVHVCFPGWHNE